jgi:mannose-6-phosphate isomerase-like protein (cupin superfamily)
MCTWIITKRIIKIKGAKVIQKVFCMKLKSKQQFLRLLGDKDKISGLRSGLVSLKPQESIGEHKTTNKEEVVIILKGSAIVHYGKNKKIKVSQDSFIYIPPEVIHDISNCGRTILQYVYVTALHSAYRRKCAT